MEVVGILSFIFGMIGLVSSVWYIGILPCVVGIVLGIIGLTDFLADKNFAITGLLISVLGTVVSVYMFVSDVDSGRLIVLYNNGKVQGVDAVDDRTDDISKPAKENKVMEVSKREEKTVTEQENARASEKEERKAEVKQTDSKQGNQELYRDNNIVITYTGLHEKDYDDGYEITFSVENLSNKTLTVQLRETSINGIMVDPICSIDIAPGRKAIDDAEIWGDDARNIPLSEVRNIETKFHIYNEADWDDSYDTENIVVLDSTENNN